ncbi:hypothetical protein CEXT_479521 [Caerostris extrusa]|uniref:Uncharacterized protein n=1 Tax=Caerostris extrusa TaxID=172846 RepID=A0AAV4MJ31_CAEEX|nr:hypothetical protein CEXT_479521 [Caerostris extrusa]
MEQLEFRTVPRTRSRTNLGWILISPLSFEVYFPGVRDRCNNVRTVLCFVPEPVSNQKTPPKLRRSSAPNDFIQKSQETNSGLVFQTDGTTPVQYYASYQVYL